jgi:hypothetical protein
MVQGGPEPARLGRGSPSRVAEGDGICESDPMKAPGWNGLSSHFLSLAPVLVGLALAPMGQATTAGEVDPPRLATAATGLARLSFVPSAGGAFTFDTGVLRGKLRPNGKTRGLSSVVHIPSGVMLDRGDQGYGLFSHYRVFTANHRYGGGAWDWPSTAKAQADGSVVVDWAPQPGRPFSMRAVYRWAAPDTLDLETSVTAQSDLSGFESFLASYFSEKFTNAMVVVSGPPPETGKAGFLSAEKSLGDWLMFPRDAAALALVQDGRWKIEPNPVAWVRLRPLARPIAVRRDPVSGVTAALMAPTEDCFAVAMPFQTEGHYSVYLSLFGRDVKAGETARARARLQISGVFSEPAILERQQALSRTGPAK